MNSRRVVLFLLICLIVITAALGAMACSDLSSKHTVIFNVKYGDDWTAYASFRTKGATIFDFPDDPTKEGYVFAGWYIDMVCSKEGHEYDYENTELTEDVNYYAKFVPASSITNPYTVTFEANKGSAVAAQDINFGGKVDGTKIATTRPGFAFEGWYLEPEFKTEWRVEYDRVWKSRTLYAKWFSTGYILTYELDGGTNHPQNPSIYKFEDGLSLFEPTKLGYDFEGWYLDSEFTIEFDKETLYDDNLTIYAKWSDPIVYTISYELGEGETLNGVMPSEYTVLDNPLELPTVSKTGYDFTGWFIDKDEGVLFEDDKTYAQNFNLKPSLAEHKYYITYVLNGGTNNSNNKPFVTYFHNKVTLFNPAKKGYDFEGWFSDSGFSTPFASGTAIEDDQTLYANWTLASYDITYHLDGATCDTSFNSYTINDNPLTLPIPTKSTLYFGGWYLNSELTNAFNKDIEYAEDIDLYPKFVDSELLLPEHYILCSTSNSLVLDKTLVQTSSGKNVCIPTDKGIGVKSVVFNGNSVESTSYIYSATEDILVIENAVFCEEDLYHKYLVVPGDKYELTVTFNDDSIKTYIVTIRNSGVAFASVSNYVKGTTPKLEIGLENVTVTTSNILDVSIDGYSVDHAIESGLVTVSSATMDKLSIGRHLLEVTTINGSQTINFFVTTTSEYAPYNVKVDIDSDPGKVWITWDEDSTSASMKVIIGVNEYSSDSYTSLFDGNRFNATGKLTTAGQTFSVVAHVNTEDYPSSNYTFKYNMTAALITEYLTNDIVVYGKSMNRFISSWEELYDILFYTAIRGSELSSFGGDYTDHKAINICIDFDLSEASQIDWTYSRYTAIDSSNRVLTYGPFVNALIFETISNMPEAMPLSLVRSPITTGLVDGQTYKFGFKYLGEIKSTIERTASSHNSKGYKDAEYYAELYGKNASDYTQFPIEVENNGTATVTTSVELYLALEHGYNPIIPSGNTALTSLYNTMKSRLRNIVDEDMTDYQKVAAIYQWLATQVLYDHDAATEATTYYNNMAKAKANGDSTSYDYWEGKYYETFGWSCFYMEGVFNDNLAVCNGIASAFSAMCNMLNIKCYKLTGEATDSEENVQQHAWNKVYIGGNWYVCDATWGSTSVNTWELLTYKYLFMDEETATVTYKHIAKPTPYGDTYASDTYIDVYKLLKFTYSAKTYDFTVANQDDFDRIYNYAISKYGTPTSGQIIVIEAESTNSASVFSYANVKKYTTYYSVYTLKTSSDMAIMVRK